MIKRLGVFAALAILCVTPAFLQAGVNAKLNEIRISDVANDNNGSNFFEIAGSPGSSLDNIWVLTISAQFDPEKSPDPFEPILFPAYLPVTRQRHTHIVAKPAKRLGKGSGNVCQPSNLGKGGYFR